MYRKTFGIAAPTDLIQCSGNPPADWLSLERLEGQLGLFLDAPSHLYEGVSVPPSVRPSVSPQLFSKMKSTPTTVVVSASCAVYPALFLG